MFVVFDLDGTLADIRHRLHFIDGEKRDWQGFFAACVNDVPNMPVIWTLLAHEQAGDKIRIWSARSDIVRGETEEWLASLDIDPSYLEHMRADGDMTPDVELKRHWLLALHPDERPDVIYDDRQSVVDMWRDEGIACFQVAANWEQRERVIAPVVDWPLLTIMVGPSGAGKTTWLEDNQKHEPTVVYSSDRLRGWYCGDFRDQSRNEDVFHTIHKMARATLECGLPVTIDATNLRRKDRLTCVSLAPAGVAVRYVVINRPMAERIRDAGWRAEVTMGDGKSLLEAHEQRFNSALKDILRGDGLPNVTVIDARQDEIARAA